MLKNLHFEKLHQDLEKFVITENDSYVKTYPYFLKYFENINMIEEENLIISSHFVYGWMPTIIQLDLSQKDKVLFLLNAVKSGHILDQSEIEILKKSVNNSLVGLSKLLHFINPRHYAIWDSRIFRYLTEKKSDYGIGNPKYYLEYLTGIKKITENKNYKRLHTVIEQNFDYEIYPTRAIEILMFETDRTRQISLRKNKFVIETAN